MKFSLANTIIVLCLLAMGLCFPMEANRALFNTLDLLSVRQALAFYELYPSSEEGKAALLRATKLLRGDPATISALYPHVNRFKGSSEYLPTQIVEIIERLAAQLPNRRLKGYYAKNELEILSLPSEEIDLGKALLLSQLANELDAYQQARSYSARLDLMALQILATLPKKPTVEEKIKAINCFIFDQMRFRFPPQSIYAQDIDLYTFLPSVMDNHLGVCLGVTALYLAVAQRLDLPLEIITPPGHIYIRHRRGNHIINIETTARGIHVPSESYLSVNTCSLQKRSLKEVIGMTHFNQASAYLYNENYQKAVKCYEKAYLYIRGDPLIKELLGYSYLLVGKKEGGEKLLREIKDVVPEGELVKHSLTEDYLNGEVDVEGIKSVFLFVDETAESIRRKQKQLEKILKAYPNFRDGHHQMAVAWIQLNRAKEAIESLETYHVLDANNPAIEYYLAVLHGQRYNFKSCWYYLVSAEAITGKRHFYPKALRELRRLLTMHCPEDIVVSN